MGASVTRGPQLLGSAGPGRGTHGFGPTPARMLRWKRFFFWSNI